MTEKDSKLKILIILNVCFHFHKFESEVDHIFQNIDKFHNF